MGDSRVDIRQGFAAFAASAAAVLAAGCSATATTHSNADQHASHAATNSRPAPQGPVTVGALAGTCVMGYENSPYSQFHPGTPHGTVPALAYQVTISHPHGSGTVQPVGYTVRFYNAAGAPVGTQRADTTGSLLGDQPTNRSFTWTVLS